MINHLQVGAVVVVADEPGKEPIIGCFWLFWLGQRGGRRCDNGGAVRTSNENFAQLSVAIESARRSIDYYDFHVRQWRHRDGAAICVIDHLNGGKATRLMQNYNEKMRKKRNSKLKCRTIESLIRVMLYDKVLITVIIIISYHSLFSPFSSTHSIHNGSW